MKKQLLFGFAAFLALGANAQNSKTLANPKVTKIKKTLPPSTFEPASKVSTGSAVSTNKPSSALYPRIGGSSNVLGVQFSESRALQYNKDINTVGMVLRKQTGWTGVANGNSGTICYSYSTNNGMSWDSTVIAANGTHFHRYPGGTMYNPAGNTNPSNAYALASGPWHPGANWQGSFFGAKQLSFPGNNNNGVVVYSDNLALGPNQRKQDFTRTDYQVTTNGVAHVAGDITNDANATTTAAYGWRGAMINYGTHAGSGVFNWTVDSLKPNFKLDGTGDPQGSQSYNMAWSEDGLTGYVTFYGVDANAQQGTPANSYQPYVYKTTNGGTSWARHAPLFDFTSIPEIGGRLYAVGGTTGTPFAKPFIYPNESSAATVDANGNMHLFCSMTNASSDHVDSLGYTYGLDFANIWNYIVDFRTTSNGWCAVVIDSLKCEGPTSNASDPSGVGTSNWLSSGTPFAYDARLQVSRTTNGNYIFYSWADSDPAITGGNVSTQPDIYMKAYDVVNDKFTTTKDVCTGKIGLEYVSYWFYAATKVMEPTATDFIVPTIVTQSDDGSNDGDAAVSYYYVNNNGFNTSEFTMTVANSCASTVTGIKTQATALEHLTFYPNPASAIATIDVQLNETAKLDVSILNTVGQTIYSTSISGNIGSNKIDVNLSGLSSGLYFYQVKVGNSKAVTKKFAVDK